MKPQISPVRSPGPTGQAQIDADYEFKFGFYSFKMKP